MTKADDSSLDPEQLRAVEARAKKLLDRASAWETFPTPVADILEAANLKVAPTSAFDPVVIFSYLQKKTADVARHLKGAVEKAFGIYDSVDELIHIDSTVHNSKQTFLKLHETAHHELPTHKRMFKFFADCAKNLAPEIADLFEREANNFARFVLFKGDGFAVMAADYPFEIRTPMKLAKKFGASVYASVREYARTNHRACLVYILESIEFCEVHGAKAVVRRVEPSPSFEKQFGRPQDTVITLDHVLGKILPINRKMTKARTIRLKDLNGDEHECMAEAFDTTFNILILVYPVKALTTSRIIIPAGARTFQPVVAGKLRVI